MFLSGHTGECQGKAVGAKVGALSAVFSWLIVTLYLFIVSFFLPSTTENMDNTRKEEMTPI